MARDRVQHRSFTGGEISPYLEQRADLARWQTSVSELLNWVVMVQGGVTRRSGTRDVLEALDESRLIPFSFSANDGYAIEFAPLVSRFFRDFGVLESAPATPYELATPFIADDILALDYAQSADVMYLTCGNRPIQKLSRLGELDWTIGDLPVKLGPFMDENDEDGIVLTTDYAGGYLEKGTVFTLIADAPLFDPLHVGALWKISVQDRSRYQLWQPQFTVAVGNYPGDSRYWGDNFYRVTEISDGSDVKTGMVPPIHTFGEECDGAGPNSNLGVKWKYLHGGWGVVKITAFIDSTHVTVEAQTYVPDEIVTALTGANHPPGPMTGTWRWAEGAWSEYRGYPRIIALHKKRLIAGSTKAQPSTFWASVLDDHPNFKNGSLATDGFTETLQSGSNQVNQNEWLSSSGGKLWIGTSGDEFAIPKSATREPLTPGNVDVDNATAEGSAPIKPAKVDSPIFVSKDRRRLHETGFDFAAESYIAPDMTIFADHITESGVVELAWQREPYRLLWALRSDGVLACTTLRKDQQVNAWHRHAIAGGRGKVKSIAAAPSPTGIRQDLWAIVEYDDLLAGTVRRVQCLMPFFERTTLDVKDAWFVDCGFIYDGAPVTTISGIPAFLEGETVSVLADGKVQPPKVVTGGAIALGTAKSKVVLGLKMTSRLKTLRYDRDLQGGVLAGKKTRIDGIVLDLLRAASVKIASGDREPEYITNEAGKVMDASAPLMTGATRPTPVEAGWEDNNGQATIVCDDPLPATIRAITIDMRLAG